MTEKEQLNAFCKHLGMSGEVIYFQGSGAGWYYEDGDTYGYSLGGSFYEALETLADVNGIDIDVAMEWIEANTKRVCRKCGKTFPATREYWYYWPTARDNLDTTCKFCRCVNSQLRYAEKKRIQSDKEK